MIKKLNRSAKISILKSKGQAQEWKGKGIYGFTLNARSTMVKLGGTWDEAIAFCEAKGWFKKYETAETGVKIWM